MSNNERPGPTARRLLTRVAYEHVRASVDHAALDRLEIELKEEMERFGIASIDARDLARSLVAYGLVQLAVQVDRGVWRDGRDVSLPGEPVAWNTLGPPRGRA